MEIILYIIIGLLIVFIIFLIKYHMMMINSYEERVGKYIKRYMTNDAHLNSKINFLTLLLLETNGINTGVKSRAQLHRDFVSEVSDNLEIKKYGEELVNEKLKGKKSKTEKTKNKK